MLNSRQLFGDSAVQDCSEKCRYSYYFFLLQYSSLVGPGMPFGDCAALYQPLQRPPRSPGVGLQCQVLSTADPGGDVKGKRELCSLGEESSAGPLEVSPRQAASWLPAAPLPAGQCWSCLLCQSESGQLWVVLPEQACGACAV